MASCTEPLRPSDECLLLMMGIPGSGKTYLSRELVSRRRCSPNHCPSHEKLGSASLDILHVCMDDYYPKDERRETIEEPVARCCSVFDWKRSRRAVLANIDDYLSGKPNPMFTISREEASQSLIILIDDNLHLRSMRKEFYQLARKYMCGFATIYLHCQLETALERNSSRLCPIPHQTIVKMHDSIEPPQENWERHSVTFDSTSNSSNWVDIACIKIIELSQAAMQTPEALLPDLTAEKVESQKITSESLLHQADQVLRQFVSSEVKAIQSKADNTAIKDTAMRANEARKKILHELKDSNELLSTKEELKDFLKSKFIQCYRH